MNFDFLVWLFICGALAVFIVLAGIPKLIQLARLKHLFDDPVDDRKIHEKKIPNIGGLIILTAIFTPFLLHPAVFGIHGLQYLLVAAIILTIIGLKDDLLVTSPAKKLIGQVIAVSLLIFGAGVVINDFEGVFGIQNIPLYLAIPLTYFVFIVIINAVNLIDGIDGLASSIIIFASLFFGGWFYFIGDTGLAALSLLMAVSFAAFLFFNWSPATVFMGDTGSLNAGLILAYLGIQYLNTSIQLDDTVFFQSAAPVVLVAVFIIPLYDTLRVFIIRMYEGNSPFHPDTNHIHHQCIEFGLSHSQTSLMLVFLNVTLVAVTLILSLFLPNTLLLGVLTGLCVLFFPTYYLKRNLLKKIIPVSSASPENNELRELSGKNEPADVNTGEEKKLHKEQTGVSASINDAREAQEAKLLS